MNKNLRIELGHGSGGVMTAKLVKELFLAHFDNRYLEQESDSVLVKTKTDLIACTTDSYVIHPLFFSGGDLGKLSVCGTVNDLAVSGADPRYLTAAFILEEGLDISVLERIVKSMKEEADRASVKIIAGDTKVVGKGQADQIFINTTGLGFFDKNNRYLADNIHVEKGDLVLISGTAGDHEAAIINAREKLFESSLLVSDCASLNGMISSVLENSKGVKFMRDITRGGTAGIVNEIAALLKTGIELDEAAIPISEQVSGFCEMLGYDPLHFASEGKCIMIISRAEAENALSVLKKHSMGKNAAIIGKVTDHHPGEVILNTFTGGRRILLPPVANQVPRIC
jgi:hydrogenase expression/formation protein HypE